MAALSTLQALSSPTVVNFLPIFGFSTIRCRDFQLHTVFLLTWPQKANFPGLVRATLFCFSYVLFLAHIGGKLYAGTGEAPGFTCANDVRSYDLATGTWSTLANHPLPQHDNWAVAVPSLGRIYVIGGPQFCFLGCIFQCHYYDLLSGTWHAMPPFPGGSRNNLNFTIVSGVL